MNTYSSQETQNLIFNLFNQEVACDIPAAFFLQITNQFID